MNPDLDRLQPYPFQKLHRLLDGVRPPPDLAPIVLSIGEPGGEAPALIRDALAAHLEDLSRYPVTRGSRELRAAICAWLDRRFTLEGALDPDRHCLPLNGTREGLFAIAQALVDPGATTRPVVAMPNPFYQIYEGAALLAGGDPWYIPCPAHTGFKPDLASVPEAIWERCQLLYLCSPGNPTGAVLDEGELQAVLALADRHDFVVAADECYSEIYPDEAAPPPGLLGAAARAGRRDFRRCLVFHSLSKRSGAPGLRSGFVAGDPELIETFYRYRTYHGCAMPLPSQAASIAAWEDEAHVARNRAGYRERFDAVLPVLEPVLDVYRPDAGFYLWAGVGGDDAAFARDLYAATGVTVLPGSYLSRPLSRTGGDADPGRGRVRMALVAPVAECVEAAQRIRAFVEHGQGA